MISKTILNIISLLTILTCVILSFTSYFENWYLIEYKKTLNSQENLNNNSSSSINGNDNSSNETIYYKVLYNMYRIDIYYRNNTTSTYKLGEVCEYLIKLMKPIMPTSSTEDSSTSFYYGSTLEGLQCTYQNQQKPEPTQHILTNGVPTATSIIMSNGFIVGLYTTTTFFQMFIYSMRLKSRSIYIFLIVISALNSTLSILSIVLFRNLVHFHVDNQILNNDTLEITQIGKIQMGWNLMFSCSIISFILFISNLIESICFLKSNQYKKLDNENIIEKNTSNQNS